VSRFEVLRLVGVAVVGEESVCEDTKQQATAMGDESVDATKKPESPGAGPSLHSLSAQAEVDENKLLQELQKLLDAGADPNEVDSFDRAPLSLLCMNTGHLDAAKALLAAGALPSSPDAWGR